jgi:hypothetical protein
MHNEIEELEQENPFNAYTEEEEEELLEEFHNKMMAQQTKEITIGGVKTHSLSGTGSQHNGKSLVPHGGPKQISSR